MLQKIKDKIKLKVIATIRDWQEYNEKNRLKDLIKKGFLTVGEGTYNLPKIKHDPYAACKVNIGKYCSIANHVTIFNGSNHNPQWISTYPFRIIFDMEGKFTDGHPSSKGDVIIGNDVWIGEGTVILSGVKIGDGAVIAGYSVVVKNVEAYSIVGGSPAKFIRKRFSDMQITALQKMQWWNWDKEKIKAAVPFLCSENLDDFLKKHS